MAKVTGTFYGRYYIKTYTKPQMVLFQAVILQYIIFISLNTSSHLWVYTTSVWRSWNCSPLSLDKCFLEWEAGRGWSWDPWGAFQDPWYTSQSQRQVLYTAGDVPATVEELFVLSVLTTGCWKEAMGLSWVSKWYLCYDKSAGNK